ncbi:CarD family transcriptional regulator [Bacteriovorax sp. Seq25_V]|uniref:CarD family transcriptional regulator n=1 Tax=Bacteriovorax sp. Seq25_V TaxID=1201288 RepID=UPI00038A3B4F|nr:CarD family transcriptional regulator [Bacteriovorax sp. Seq25_V]EQC47990.1 hypothetical protein M900_A0064 [Bacteriovorax sp. Seq25_V]
MNKKLCINDKVISSSFGLGVIVDIERPEGTNRDFYVIESVDHNIRTMVPLEKSATFRLLTPQNDLNDHLKLLSSEVPTPEFDSKKDRITYFKGQVTHQNIDEVFMNVRTLVSINDRGAAETKILSNFLDNIVLEVMTVFDLEEAEAKDLVNKSLEQKFKI